MFILLPLKKINGLKFQKKKNVAIFESDSFEKGDKITFKITAYEFNDDDIKFEFLDNINIDPTFDKDRKESPEMRKDAKDVYDDSDIWPFDEGQTYYYSIKKDKNYLENIEGKYLAIYFDVNSDYPTIIENYKKIRIPLLVLLLQ
jgi:hypothetical protein